MKKKAIPPFTLTAGQSGRLLFNFTLPEGAEMPALRGALMVQGQRVDMENTQADMLTIPALPAGVYLTEVRAAGVCVLYGHVEVLPSPLSGEEGLATYRVDVDNTAEVLQVNITMLEGPQGPQGPQGEQGPAGPQGEKGDTGAAAGFDTPTATVTTLDAGSPATVSVTATGDNTSKKFAFAFGIPRGADGEGGGGSTTGEPIETLTSTTLTMQHARWFDNSAMAAVAVSPATWNNEVITCYLKTSIPVALSGVTWLYGEPAMAETFTYVIALQQIDASTVLANLAYTLSQ